MFQTILTIVLFLPILLESKENWSYENIKSWPQDFHYCRGNLQSPIDLQFNISVRNRDLKRLYFQRQQSALDLPQLINNGHSAQVNYKNHYILKNVASSGEDYIVEQLHFHWGDRNNNARGSEHLLEGQSYPLEMHIVTYSSWFTNINEAMRNTRALAVIGLFFELNDEPNKDLQPIVDGLAYIRRKGEQQPINDSFKLIPLTGENGLRRYYRYDGSLTTPPCYESVIWSVLPEPLKISMEQLDAFRALYDEKNLLMKNTYRHIQPHGTRKLFRSFHTKNLADEAKHRESTAGYGVQDLPMHMKIFFVVISFLMMKI